MWEFSLLSTEYRDESTEDYVHTLQLSTPIEPPVAGAGVVLAVVSHTEVSAIAPLCVESRSSSIKCINWLA